MATRRTKLVRDGELGRTLRLEMTGTAGGESVLCDIEGRPGEVALVSKRPGGYPPDAADKFLALRERVKADPAFADPGTCFPLAVLFDDATGKVVEGIRGKRFPGFTEDLLLYPKERQRLGVAHWARGEHAFLAAERWRKQLHSEVHRYVRVDFNPTNTLVDKDAATGEPTAVYEIDVARFSFHWNQRRHLTSAVREEFLPPELHEEKSRTGAFDPCKFDRFSDRFGEACHTFCLLTGRLPHDFPGAESDPVAHIRKRQFAFVSAPAGTVYPKEMSDAWDALPSGFTELFKRAFLGKPSGRPSPQEFLEALTPLIVMAPAAPPVPDMPAVVPSLVPGLADEELREWAKRNRWTIAAGVCFLLAWLSLLEGGKRRQPGRVSSQPPAASAPADARLPGEPPPDPDAFKFLRKRR